MDASLRNLQLLCRQSVEEINLDRDLVLIQGPIAVGKSSALKLIDFCLGGDHPWPLPIQKEVLSVSLRLRLGSHDVTLERKLNAPDVEAAWSTNGHQPEFLKVPIERRQE